MPTVKELERQLSPHTNPSNWHWHPDLFKSRNGQSKG